MNQTVRCTTIAIAIAVGGIAWPAAANASAAPNDHADCIGALSSVEARQAPGAVADNLHAAQDLYGNQVVGQFNQQVSKLHGSVDDCIQ